MSTPALTAYIKLRLRNASATTATRDKELRSGLLNGVYSGSRIFASPSSSLSSSRENAAVSLLSVERRGGLNLTIIVVTVVAIGKMVFLM